jgi:hypothetical protein
MQFLSFYIVTESWFGFATGNNEFGVRIATAHNIKTMNFKCLTSFCELSTGTSAQVVILFTIRRKNKNAIFRNGI